MAAANRQVQDFNSHVGDDFYDARLTEPEETKKIIENLLLSFLSDVANGKNPSMELVSVCDDVIYTINSWCLSI